MGFTRTALSYESAYATRLPLRACLRSTTNLKFELLLIQIGSYPPSRRSTPLGSFARAFLLLKTATTQHINGHLCRKARDKTARSSSSSWAELSLSIEEKPLSSLSSLDSLDCKAGPPYLLAWLHWLTGLPLFSYRNLRQRAFSELSHQTRAKVHFKGGKSKITSLRLFSFYFYFLEIRSATAHI